MEVQEIREKVTLVKKYLLELKGVCSVIDTENWTSRIEEGEFKARTHVSEVSATTYEEASRLKLLIENNVPSGYEVGGNLIRHLSWLQVGDLFDIFQRDIDAELLRLKRFEDHLVLVEYFSGLHPKVAVVKTLVLEGNYDMALKAVYSSLEARIRSITKDGPRTGIKASLAKAFTDGVLKHSKEEYHEPARDFLIGVLTYFRSQISHYELPPNRNTLETSLSLFAVAHEAFTLLDRCEAESNGTE